MPRPGIQILEDVPGTGEPAKPRDRVRIRYDILLNQGERLFEGLESIFTVGRRDFVAGFRYGLEGMRTGGRRRFKASPHLCYRDQKVGNVPANAVLVFHIKEFEILTPTSADPAGTGPENPGTPPPSGLPIGG